MDKTMVDPQGMSWVKLRGILCEYLSVEDALDLLLELDGVMFSYVCQHTHDKMEDIFWEWGKRWLHDHLEEHGWTKTLYLFPDDILHTFACNLAEYALDNYSENPDPCSYEAIRVKRLWLQGKATDQELKIARAAAWVTVWEATEAAWAVTEAARAAAWEAAWAARAAAWAASEAATEAAAEVAADATEASEKRRQIEHLTKLLQEDFGEQQQY